MKLSFIFELLLIFVLIAFAASAAVIESSNHHRRSRKTSVKKHKTSYKRQDSATNAVNRFCSCSAQTCNCCRDFNIPVVPLKGPGCASLQYLKGDRLAISMSFGDRVLTNTTISGRKPQPVCMPLPGGVSKFCGRVYNIGREGNEFNACLGLELRALNEVEAALRVSCFRFGSKGLRVEPPQPLPVLEEDESDDDDDDDDEDDDDFDYDDTDSDYESFSVLDDDFIGGYFQEDDSEPSSNNKKKVTTTKTPLRRVTRKPTLKPVKTQQKKPLRRKATPKPIKVTTMTKNKLIKSSTEMPTTDMPVMVNEVIPSNSSVVEDLRNSTSEMDANMTETTATSQDLGQNDVTEASTQPDGKTEITTLAAQPTTNASASNNEDEDDDDDDDDDSDESSEEDEDDEDDPIADAVGDALGDDESTEKSKKPVGKSPNEKPMEESKEVLDDIMDSVVDTIAGEGSDESRTLVKATERKTSGRQSRVMSFR